MTDRSLTCLPVALGDRRAAGPLLCSRCLASRRKDRRVEWDGPPFFDPKGVILIDEVGEDADHYLDACEDCG